MQFGIVYYTDAVLKLSHEVGLGPLIISTGPDMPKETVLTSPYQDKSVKGLHFATFHQNNLGSLADSAKYISYYILLINTSVLIKASASFPKIINLQEFLLVW